VYASREARLHQLETDASARLQRARDQSHNELEAKRRNVAETATLQESGVRTTFQQAQVHLKEALLSQEVCFPFAFTSSLALQPQT
jgi:hypothetical protein